MFIDVTEQDVFYVTFVIYPNGRCNASDTSDSTFFANYHPVRLVITKNVKKIIFQREGITHSVRKEEAIGVGLFHWINPWVAIEVGALAIFSLHCHEPQKELIPIPILYDNNPRDSKIRFKAERDDISNCVSLFMFCVLPTSEARLPT